MLQIYQVCVLDVFLHEPYMYLVESARKDFKFDVQFFNSRHDIHISIFQRVGSENMRPCGWSIQPSLKQIWRLPDEVLVWACRELFKLAARHELMLCSA